MLRLQVDWDCHLMLLNGWRNVTLTFTGGSPETGQSTIKISRRQTSKSRIGIMLSCKKAHGTVRSSSYSAWLKVVWIQTRIKLSGIGPPTILKTYLKVIGLGSKWRVMEESSKSLMCFWTDLQKSLFIPIHWVRQNPQLKWSCNRKNKLILWWRLRKMLVKEKRGLILRV